MICTGVYDVAATALHWRFTTWLLKTARTRSVKAQAAVIQAPPDLDDPAKVLIGVDHCAVRHGAPAFWKSLSRLTSGPMLGRHVRQCLCGAINAGGGHGLIAHNAALVWHHVGTTQHLVLLVWGGRACGDSQNQNHSAEPSHCSFHAPIPVSRVHVLIPSTIGYGNLKLPTKFRVRVPLKLLRIRGPTGNDPDQAVVLLPILCVFGEPAISRGRRVSAPATRASPSACASRSE